MSQQAFESLPSEWQDWLLDNAARGCTPQSLVAPMCEGGFEAQWVEAAVQQAFLRQAALPLRVSRPDIDTALNRYPVGGQWVEIVLALDKPKIVVLKNVLQRSECEALMAMAAQRQQRSTVVESDHGQSQVHAERTSYGAMFQRGETDWIGRIETRLAELCRWPVNQAEGLQVLRYAEGDEYKAHFDWFDPQQAGPRQHLQHGGQRLGTLVLYLSEVEAGGGTRFPRLGLEVRPQQGGAVFFANVDEQGQPDRQTLHAGIPVTRGVKWIATKWLRESAY